MVEESFWPDGFLNFWRSDKIVVIVCVVPQITRAGSPNNIVSRRLHCFKCVSFNRFVETNPEEKKKTFPQNFKYFSHCMGIFVVLAPNCC